MTTITNNTSENLVQDLRQIRDEISKEIKDMTFEEERAYLDQLLAVGQSPAPNHALANSRLGH